MTYWECNACTFLTYDPEKASDHEADHSGHLMMRIQECDNE